MFVGLDKLIDPSRVIHVWVSPRRRTKHSCFLLFSNAGYIYDFSKRLTITEDIARWDDEVEYDT